MRTTGVLEFISSVGASILLVAGLSVVAPGVVSLAQAQEHCGDHNRSGDVSATDALLLLQFAVGYPVEVGCPTGLHCWDGDGNGICDDVDDLNQDGYCDMLDCQGPIGPEGPMGGHGGDDLSALTARLTALEAAVAALQQLHAAE